MNTSNRKTLNLNLESPRTLRYKLVNKSLSLISSICDNCKHPHCLVLRRDSPCIGCSNLRQSKSLFLEVNIGQPHDDKIHTQVSRLLNRRKPSAAKNRVEGHTYGIDQSWHAKFFSFGQLNRQTLWFGGLVLKNMYLVIWQYLHSIPEFFKFLFLISYQSRKLAKERIIRQRTNYSSKDEFTYLSNDELKLSNLNVSWKKMNKSWFPHIAMFLPYEQAIIF